MGNSKTISLGKKDVVLKVWRKRIIEEQDDGLLSYLIKQALSYYIHNGECMVVSKLYISQQEIQSIPQTKTSINIYINDRQEIVDWIENVSSKQGAKPLALIKEILRNSVQVVSEKEEEWFPGYVYFDLNMGNNILHNGHNIQKVAVPVIKESKKLDQQNVKSDKSSQHNKQGPKKRNPHNSGMTGNFFD